MPYRLAAFADEISPDIQVEMDYLLDHGIRLCCLRGANQKGVLDFEEFQVPLIKSQFFNRGIRFSALGSPVGKSLITAPFDQELERFQRACLRAKQFEIRAIRIFSFYLPEGEDRETRWEEVLRRLTLLAQQAKEQNLNLLLENAADTYADTADHCAGIFSTVNSPNLMCAFDFASFVLAGEDPAAVWPKLKNWVKDFHIKDAAADGGVRVAGQGQAHIPEVLAAALQGGWAGLLTLEPHLDRTPEFQGKTGGEQFGAAVEALKGILAGIGR